MSDIPHHLVIQAIEEQAKQYEADKELVDRIWLLIKEKIREESAIELFPRN